MTAFILVAALLVIAVLAILLPPLWRSPGPSSSADQREANLAIFRDQLGELERDRDAGSLAAADFEQARSELQRRLLDELPLPSAGRPRASSSRRTAIALALVLPLAAAAGYALLGNPTALDPLQRQARVSPEQIEKMLAGLVEKLQKNPEDSKGWVMLARSYKVLARYPEAAEAYRQAGALVEADPALLADYAEVLSEVNGGKLQGRPSELIAQALKIDPDAPQALLLAGAAASERQQYAAAADHWARLLTQVETGSDEAKALAAAISRARGMAAQQANGTATSKAVAGAGKVSGEVALSGKLAGQARPDDVLFVFARAEEGSRMPLAATRATVAELPLRFALDDAMALAGGRKISDFASVSVEARIVKAGQAQSSSGDLFGTLTGVKPGSQNLRLLIDQVQP
ncbi:MAG: c-type cytochrome biogenesis protein CcmI [Candidatus Accumulibacter sp. UW20]|jgi:cytochrome c-type biogenesis protein CcmH